MSILSPSVFAQDEKKTKKNNDPHIHGNVDVGIGASGGFHGGGIGGSGVGQVGGSISIGF